MEKMLILGLFGHFYTEINLEMMPNLSRQLAESAEAAIPRQPAKTCWFISRHFFVHN